MNILADAYGYNIPTNNNSSLSIVIVIFLLILSLLFIALFIFEIVAVWKVFTKAGKPGWASLIPVYNTWVLAEIAGKPGWWGLFPLLLVIPLFGWIAALVIYIVMSIGVARNFGKSDVFGFFGLWLFSGIGYPILAYGPATYIPTSGLPPLMPAIPPAMQ